MRLFRNTQAGVAGGFLAGLLPVIGKDELARTLVLAAAGAATSFVVSFFLQWIVRQRRGKRKE